MVGCSSRVRVGEAAARATRAERRAKLFIVTAQVDRKTTGRMCVNWSWSAEERSESDKW